MASLLETVKTNSQQLGKVSQEELQSLASRAQRPLQPTTPTSAAEIGASPDQAKMAGTPANRLSALRTAVKQTEQYETAKRREEAAKATEEQRKRIEEQERLSQNLNSMINRPNKLLGEILKAKEQQLLVPADKAKAEVSKKAIETMGVSADKQEAAALAMDKIVRGEDVNNQLLSLGNMLGRPVSAEQVTSMVKAAEETVGNAVAQQAKATKLTMGNLSTEDFAKLGMPNVQDVKQLSGLMGFDVSGMTWDEFADKARADINSKANQTAIIKQKLSDPAVGPAERAELNKQLRNLGATGVRSAEEKVNDIAAQLQDGDTVVVNGTSVDLTDVFSDASITSKMKEYTEETDPAKKEELIKSIESTYGTGLASYVKDNEKAIKDQVKAVSPAVATFAKIQEDNKKLFEPQDLGGVSFAPDVLNKIFPGYSDQRSAALNPASLPEIIRIATDTRLPTAQRSQVVQFMNDMKNHPEFQKYAGMNYDQLKAAGVFSPGKAAELINNTEQVKSVEAAGSDEEIIQVLFGNDPTFNFNEFTESLKAFPTSDWLRARMDFDGDGKIDAPNSLKEMFLKVNKTQGLEGVSSLKRELEQVKQSSMDLKQAANQYKETNRLVQGISSQIQDSLKESIELKKKMNKPGISTEEFRRMQARYNEVNRDIQGLQDVQATVNKARNETNTFMKTYKPGTKLPEINIVSIEDSLSKVLAKKFGTA